MAVRENNMKLIFKQRLFSWFDSYDIYDQNGEVVYVVKGKFAWGHCLKIYDSIGTELGTVKERVFSFFPKFEIYLGENYIGCIKKELTFFKPIFNIDYNGWHIEGDLFEWEYNILNSSGNSVATISKQIFKLTDTYVIDVFNPSDALGVLMLVLAIDAEKCSRNN